MRVRCSGILCMTSVQLVVNYVGPHNWKWSLVSARLGSSSVGPVFINPTVASSATPSEQSTQGSYVTQTVYGFLDFTTTIGNTVMVFSPQSAAPAPGNTKIFSLWFVVANVIYTELFLVLVLKLVEILLFNFAYDYKKNTCMFTYNLPKYCWNI